MKNPKTLRDAVIFVGLPLVPIDASNPNQKDSVSLMVAGSTTIVNTGHMHISAGDLVMWDVPLASSTGNNGMSDKLVAIAGTPRNKALFVTLPANARENVRDRETRAARLP